MSNEEEKQEQTSQSSVNTDVTPVQNETSPGTQLVKAREAMGLSQEQVADRLHLRLHSVKAVEENALEPGVSVTFSKGYVRLYAKLVHLEVEPLLVAYDKLHERENQPAKLQSFSRRVSREAHDQRWNMVTIVVVLLVLGSVVGWWIQQSDSFSGSQSFVTETIDSLFSEPEEEQNNNQDNNEANEAEPDTSALNLNDNGNTVRLDTQAPIPDEVVVPVDETQTAFTDNDEDSLAQALISTQDELEDDIDSTVPVLNNDVTIEPEVIAETTSSENTGSDIFSSSSVQNGIQINSDGTVDLAFTFRDDCWVSIKDVNGEVLAIGVKDKGRVMQVSGLPPIRVVLGAPQNVDINFGSQEVDMSVHPGGRSANFLLSVESE